MRLILLEEPHNATGVASDGAAGRRGEGLTKDEPLFHFDHVIDRGFLGLVFVGTSLVILRGSLQRGASDLERGAEDLRVIVNLDWEIVRIVRRADVTFGEGGTDDEDFKAGGGGGVVRQRIGRNLHSDEGETVVGGVDVGDAANETDLAEDRVDYVVFDHVTNAEVRSATVDRRINLDAVLTADDDREVGSSGGPSAEVGGDGGIHLGVPSDSRRGGALRLQAFFIPMKFGVISDLFFHQ